MGGMTENQQQLGRAAAQTAYAIMRLIKEQYMMNLRRHSAKLVAVPARSYIISQMKHSQMVGVSV
jgi:hypothetical protein